MLKIGFLGDSITEGVGASKKENRYSTLLCNLINATELNYGISGTRIARQDNIVSTNPNLDFVLRDKDIERDLDFLFVFGGTNDFGHGSAPLGKFGSKDVYTFYGAMYQLLNDLINKYGFDKNKICVIIPPHRLNEDNPYGDGSKEKPGAILKDYCKAEIEVCNYFKVDYLNLKGLPEKVDTNPNKYFIDGLHPSDLGHKVIALDLEQYLEEKKVN